MAFLIDFLTRETAEKRRRHKAFSKGIFGNFDGFFDFTTFYGIWKRRRAQRLVGTYWFYTKKQRKILSNFPVQQDFLTIAASGFEPLTLRV